MRTLAPAHDGFARRARAFYVLTKPRVNTLIVFCAVIGMFLAVPDGLPEPFAVFCATLGIACVAGAAAAMNCLVEQHIDARMARTRGRPLPRGELAAGEVLAFAGMLGGFGLTILHRAVNPLTMWLTLATFVGYAVVYTIFLKPRTPQNIVIGGASGAMPPVLGWAAITGEVSADALLLFLIIFAWTPPHFWALALYRTDDYARAGLPMLPVTHGSEFTRLSVLLYTLILFGVTLLPYATRMSGMVYLAAAVVLGARFIHYAWRLYRDYSDALARRTFRFSIAYLFGLFAALLADHYLPY
ncbi:heme o synthase [Thauera sinica]|uniref:Protoheme IX farnesyltransferase n=1 Tax=Thauera sinica TaxID=2665146 RepID=A0ABW1ATF8_9RHOO|nr:heme o synthase [Thauera sp. K11]ATE58807.1 protoheme IX farnesyltransferase [Thauera sp. K11]